MNYTDVFGTDTIPPAGAGYTFVTLASNTTFNWPSLGTQNPLAKIVDVSAASTGLSMLMPPTNEVSVGEDLLIRNVGSNSMSVKDNSGVVLRTIAAGAAVYFYITDNTTASGEWGTVAFGVGTSTVDAATLVGYGIKAIGSTLNQSHTVVTTASGVTIDSTHRASLVVLTGGLATFPLTTAATLGDDFFFMFRNDGTGTATIDPAAAETVDGMASLQIQPGESLILVCTGTAWYSVGFGRSTIYQFSQLTKDVSAGGTITLSAAEASNKLITFIGNPGGAVNVIVPAVVAVYYTDSQISTAQTITLKTASGSGVGIDQGARIIALCDGTNVVAAQSATANASVSLTDGNVSTPSLYFATQTNTGLYKYSTNSLGVTVNGSDVGRFTSTGLNNSPIGATTPSTGAFTTLSSTGATSVTVNSSSTALTITQTGTGNALVVEDSSSPDSTPFVIDANGKVIIGGDTLSTGTASGDFFFGPDTIDNADNARVVIRGGGGTSAARGAYVTVAGNEYVTNPGRITLAPGIGATVYAAGGFEIFRTEVTAPAASDGNVFSGTYTPTMTPVTNVTAAVANVCFYSRVGNVVTFSGTVSIDPTSAGSIEVGVSLPIASNFTGTSNAAGTFSAYTSGVSDQGSVTADATNDRLSFKGVVASTAYNSFAFTAQYRVL